MKTVFFIHGFMGHPGEFNVLGEYFVKWGYEVNSIVLSGHDKKKLNNVTYKDWENDCINYIELLINKGYKEIIIVGHSMGALLAIMLAFKYKEYVSNLILIDPSLEYLTKENNKIKITTSIKNLVKLLKEVNQLNKDNYSPIVKCSLSSIKEFTKLVKKYNKDIEKVKCPILFMHGEKDCIIPINQIKDIYNNLENIKEFIEVKNGSHWFFSSKQDDEIYNKIYVFLENNNLI